MVLQYLRCEVPTIRASQQHHSNPPWVWLERLSRQNQGHQKTLRYPELMKCIDPANRTLTPIPTGPHGKKALPHPALTPFNPLKQKASRYAIPARLVIRTTTFQTKQEAWPALPCCWWASSWKHYLLTPRLHRLQSTSKDRKGKKALLQPALTPFEHPLKEGWAGMQYRPHFQEW